MSKRISRFITHYGMDINLQNKMHLEFCHIENIWQIQVWRKTGSNWNMELLLMRV